jgi:hypothetical protein
VVGIGVSSYDSLGMLIVMGCSNCFGSFSSKCTAHFVFADSSLPCAFQDVPTSHVMRTQAEFVFQDHGSEVPDIVRATCGPKPQSSGIGLTGTLHMGSLRAQPAL